ncbi:MULTISPECIES: archease [unclassified Streptomyces]|uniref:Archease n=1 Tax=Streptomyces millisiae TaxID=3075542 RepID=A0ABU2LJ02_9ACTN|nr:archease [Streptomyces sp. DSM 44918]MDT0317262.1 archease [Streptomyces sp. DSM 44918]
MATGGEHPGGRGGHRGVPHTADLRVSAWGPTREECLTQAVRGVVESFADPSSGARAPRRRHTEIHADDDPELLVALMDDVVYRLDTAGEVPVDVDLDPIPGGLRVAYRMADADDLEPVGAAPKAVTLHDLALGRGPAGWTCSVTLDV